MIKLNKKHNILKGEAPEIGNPEHIKKLQSHQRYESELYAYGIEIGYEKHVKCTGRIFIYFTCAECGNPDTCIEINLSNITDKVIDLEFEDEQCKCTNCNCEYEFVDGLIQIVNNPLHPEKLNKEEQQCG